MKFSLLVLAISLASPAFAGRAKVLREKAKKIGEESFKQIHSQHFASLAKEIEQRNLSYQESKRDPENPPKVIKDRDEKWIGYQKNKGKKPIFISNIESSTCYDIVKKAVTDNKKISEIMVLDRMGANVCAYPETSDYDQGDEDKWIKPFLEGVSPFYGKAKKDESSGVLQLQSSYLLKDKNKQIGVIVIGSKIRLN